MAQSGTNTGVIRFALAMDIMGSVAIKTMTRCGTGLSEVTDLIVVGLPLIPVSIASIN